MANKLIFIKANGDIEVDITVHDELLERYRLAAKRAGFRTIGFWIKDTLNVASDPESGWTEANAKHN